MVGLVLLPAITGIGCLGVVLDSLRLVLPVPVRWSMSDSTLASITSQGVLTALQVGSLSVHGDVGPVHASVPLTIIAPTP